MAKGKRKTRSCPARCRRSPSQMNKAECARLAGYKWVRGKGCQVKPCPPCPSTPSKPASKKPAVPPVAKKPAGKGKDKAEEDDDTPPASEAKKEARGEAVEEAKEEARGEAVEEAKEEARGEAMEESKEEAAEGEEETKGEDKKEEAKASAPPLYPFRISSHYTIPLDLTSGRPRVVTHQQYLQYYALPGMKVFQDSLMMQSVSDIIKQLNEEVRGSSDLKLPDAKNPFPLPLGELILSKLYYMRVPSVFGVRLPPFCYFLSLARVRLLIQALIFHTSVEQRDVRIAEVRNLLYYAAMQAPGAVPAVSGNYTIFSNERCEREDVPYSAYLRFFSLPARGDWYRAYRVMDFTKLKAALRTLVRKINAGSMPAEEVIVRARMIIQFFHVVTGFRRASDRDLLIYWIHTNILCKPR